MTAYNPGIPLPDACTTMPSRKHTLLFSLLMSAYMALFMSGILTAFNTGIDAGFPARWGHNWLLAWCFAFPLVLIGAPRIRQLVTRLVGP